MSLDHFAEQRFEPLIVRVVFVNFLPLIATADDMIECTRKVHAGRRAMTGSRTENIR